MAYADYRLCDVCGGKAFYDANLNYEWPSQANPLTADDLVRDSGHALDRLGDWSVICLACAKTHKCIVVPIEGAKHEPMCSRPMPSGPRLEAGGDGERMSGAQFQQTVQQWDEFTNTDHTGNTNEHCNHDPRTVGNRKDREPAQSPCTGCTADSGREKAFVVPF